MIAINFNGVFLRMKSELPHLLASKGAIVVMASIAGLVGGYMGAACYASKHGAVGLTEAAAFEYADSSVRIDAVSTAVIQTPVADCACFHDPAITAPVVGLHPPATSVPRKQWRTP